MKKEQRNQLIQQGVEKLSVCEDEMIHLMHDFDGNGCKAYADRLDIIVGKLENLIYAMTSDIKKKEEHNMKRISVDNGNTYVTPAEAIRIIGWHNIVWNMDDETREKISDEGIDQEEAFLTRYLEVAPCDLVIG